MSVVDLSEDVERLLSEVQSLQLATLNKDDLPEASVTPCLYESGVFYIFVSRLSAHTANLLQSPRLSVLVVEDESSARNVFARRRLTFDCQAELLARETADSQAVLDRFESRSGPTLQLLRTLPDFCLFRLSPSKGSFVKGFGQAFRFQGVAWDQAEPQSG